MDSHLPTQSIPPITDNRITLFYFFKNTVSLGKPNTEILKQSGLPESILDSINTRQNSEPLWKPQSYNLSQDLSHTIDNLFHATGEKAIETWQMDKIILKLLNGKRVRHINDIESGLILKLNASAQQRLASSATTDTTPQIEFENIVCHRFKTGFSVAVVELKICNENPSHNLINEAVYSMARFNKLDWLNIQQTGKHRTSLGILMRSLLNGEDSQVTGRTYTHTMIQIKQPAQTKDLIRYLTKLARHFNDEYHINEVTHAATIIQDYENIIHCLSHEGASSGVVISDDSPELLTDYKNKVIRPVHIPLHLLAYHAEQAMQQYAINSTFWLSSKNNQTTQTEQADIKPVLLGELELHQLQLLNFELNFFHPVISHINAHNHLYHSLIKVKRLDQQHATINSNSQTISQLITDNIQQLKDKQTNQRNCRYCKIAQIGVAAAAYLTVFSIIKEGLDIIKHWHWLAGFCSVLTKYLDHYNIPVNSLCHIATIGTISLVGAFLVACITYIFARNHCANAKEHHSHGPADHAIHAVHTIHRLHDNAHHK